VNFELPNVPEDYVHRIGRTGRAGEEGCACSLVSADERGLLKDIEKVLKRSIPVQNIPGFAMAEVDGLEDARNTSRGNQNRGGQNRGGRGHGGGGGQSGRSGNGGGPGRNSRRPGFARR
jgi:ATP-dependent RNA helicase RhlE